jgi:UDP-galactopyranose mutase
MQKEFDYIIVGAGLFGAVFVQKARERGKKCLIIEKRDHVAGNCYTETIEGINVHKYGPHIFHCSDEHIWEYVNRFAKFNHFKYSPKVNYKGEIYSFPINLLTLYQVYGVTNPTQAQAKIEEVRLSNVKGDNLESWVLSQVGPELYEIFIKGYTTKQWGTEPSNLPSSIIKRLPIRFNYNDNYYFDQYQGIPIGGYTKMVENMIGDVEVKLGVDYFEDKDYWDSIANKVIYTGPIDKFYGYKFGRLNYRSLRFEHELINKKDFQGCAGVNYTDVDVPYTRIVEHKHFEFGNQPNTIITKEYPEIKGEPYYPINTDDNNKIYSRYKELAKQETNTIFGGRLATYQYLDMHQVIGQALKKASDELLPAL